MLPQPLELTLPLCMPEALLGELQHGAIVAGASQQKQRLAALYPGLAGAACEGGPTWMQWAFACVRSRSFKLRADCFALAPWIDGANHALDPTCDFRLSADGASVELVALKELQDGDEATVSYTGAGADWHLQHHPPSSSCSCHVPLQTQQDSDTPTPRVIVCNLPAGPEGLTNQRMQAQYGFVPSGGNTADRLHFATVAAAPAQSTGGGGGAAALLSLDRLQACLGEGEGMTAALSGADPYAYAVLKSLPLAAEESASGPLDGQIALAQQLMAELGAEAAGWPTSLSDDSALLQAMQEPGGGGDARLASALRYRQQRKLTVRVGMSLLQAFVNLSTAS